MPKVRQVLLVLRDELVDIMCEVSPEYKKYVVTNGNKKVLNLKVLRALHGCLESAMLWHNLHTDTLKNMGFTLNPCDSCVANKMINGEQCTIAFYVDDNKISHKDPEVVTQVIDELSKYFGKLKVQRRNKFDLLSMDIEIKDKKVKLSMINHLKDAISTYEGTFGKSKSGKSQTPGSGELLEILNTTIINLLLKLGLRVR